MAYYSKNINSDSTRDINVSVRVTAVVKAWLERQCDIELLSLSSYVYEILAFSNSKPDLENPYDMREELPHLAQIKQVYAHYLAQHNDLGKQFEEKISIYLSGDEKGYVDDLVCIYKTDVSDIIRDHIHFFFIADSHFKTHFDLVEGLHNGLLMSIIKPRYYMQRYTEITP